MKTLKYAGRFLMRSKSYTVINLLGLAFSLACCIILMRYIHRELTVDTHILHPQNVYLMMRDVDGNVYPTNTEDIDTTYFAAEHIMESTRFVTLEDDNILSQNTPYKTNVWVTDSNYFHFFHYRALHGSASLKAPDDVLLMQHFARKLFGEENPIGKTLQYGNGKIVTVRGVLENPDCKTSYSFDLILNMSLEQEWGRLQGQYLRLTSDVSAEAVNRISNVYRKTRNGDIRHRLVPVRQFYWDEALASNNHYPQMEHHGNRSHIYLLMGVCLLVFLTGIINFVNIYLVMMMKRSKEYGIKKIFGIQGHTLFMQLWTENALLVTLALFIAWLIIEITILPVSHLLESEMPYTTFDFLLSLAIWVILPFLTTLYPYIRYNYLPPIVSIRAVGTAKPAIRTRLGFLFIQYVITFLLIILSIYFGKHLHILLHTEPGFRTEGILYAKLQYEADSWQMGYEALKERHKRIEQIEQKLNECPLITQWSTYHSDILKSGSTLNILNDKDICLNMTTCWVSPDFFSLYGLQMVEGSLPDKITDNFKYIVVLNESALKAFGYKHYEEAFVRGETSMWMTISPDGKIVEGGKTLMPVEAVVKDYYPGHITAGKKPIVFVVSSPSGNNYLITCLLGKEKELLRALKQIEKEIYGTEDFEYTWLKDKVAALYDNDRRLALVYLLFAFIAVAISCLGLFGISLFDIRQRYREIAIRKVNGAGIRDLYRLLLSKYMIVLGGAFVIAVPLSYYFIYMYTRNFIVKAPVGIGIYLLTLGVVLVISAGTLAWQIRKAARIDPAKIIKTE